MTPIEIILSLSIITTVLSLGFITTYREKRAADRIMTNLKIKQEKESRVRKSLFTESDVQILELLYIGKSSREIAEELNVPRKSIDEQRRELLQKAGVRSTLELLLFALEYDVIRLKNEMSWN